MNTVRTNITFPKDLLLEVDKLVGEGKRSAFLAESVRKHQGFWRKKGKTIHLVDVCIAATAISNDIILVTNNYPMERLKLL